MELDEVNLITKFNLIVNSEVRLVSTFPYKISQIDFNLQNVEKVAIHETRVLLNDSHSTLAGFVSILDKSILSSLNLKSVMYP